MNNEEKTAQPFIPVADTYLTGNERKYVVDCLDTGWVSSAAPIIKKFEEKYAQFIGTKYASSCSNGTVALHLAYQACGIGPGDEVIVPNLTFIATANPARYLGAKPVLAEVDEHTWNIDPDSIEKKITPKTKAIVPVHLYGVPCDMKRIMEIAHKHGLKVIEDCAESHGATFHDKKLGSWGDAAAFSFYGNKIITTGEGGMITTNDSHVIDQIDLYKNHGMRPSRRYWHEVVGYNYRMTGLQAAFGMGQLEGIDDILAKKERIGLHYQQLLGDLPGLKWQQVPVGGKRVYWMMNIRVTPEFGMTRDQLVEELKRNNIDTRLLFYPMNELPVYQSDEAFPISQRISREGMTLPSGTTLTPVQIERVASVIKNAHANA